MPKPPILSAIDWNAVFDNGLKYKEWLTKGESKENCDSIEKQRNDLLLPQHIEGLLQAISRPVHIVAIAEDWCGDVVRHVPVMQKIADSANNIEIRYLMREDSPDVFVRFLTNGGEAIPKFVFLNDNFVECGNWGPMPEECRKLISRGKAYGDVASARKKVAAFYEVDDRCDIVVNELIHLIDIASTIQI